MQQRRTKFYRDKQNAKLMGLCAGISDFTGVNSILVRLAALLSIPVSGGFSIPIYFLVGLLADKKPAALYVDEQEKKFWQGVRQSPHRTARDVRSRFRDIDRRLADIEHYYTSNNARLSDEIEALR